MARRLELVRFAALSGTLQRRGVMRGAELMEDWDLCARMQTPKKIEPLR